MSYLSIKLPGRALIAPGYTYPALVPREVRLDA